MASIQTADASDWNDEIDRYRRGTAGKRLSVAGHQPVIPPPSLSIAQTIDDDEEFEDDPSEISLPSMSQSEVYLPEDSSFGQLPSRRDPMDDETEFEGDDGLPQQQLWIELHPTQANVSNFCLYYNTQTKEIQFTKPHDYVEPEVEATAQGFDYPENSTLVDKITYHLEHIQRHLTPSISLSPQLSKTATESLQEIQEKVDNTISLFSRMNVSGNVDYLVGWDTFTWNFSGSTAVTDYYRAAAAYRTNHEELLYQDWHFPQYFSKQPLLSTMTKCRAQISLPSSDGEFSRRTIIEVTQDETVASAIHRAATRLLKEKLNEANFKLQEYVFKVVGQREYLDHDALFFDYAHVRKCLRDYSDVELLLVQRPDPSLMVTQEMLDNSKKNVDNYLTKVNPDIQILESDTYGDLPLDISTTPIDEFLTHVTHVPITSINTPFHVRVLGLDNVTPETLPRLALHANEITHLYLRVVLFHGCTYLAQNETQHQCEMDSDGIHVFDEMIYGNAMHLFSTLPRETRVGYVIMGRTNAGQMDPNKDIALGWVVHQLIDTHGHLMTGLQDHLIWPLVAVEGKKSNKKRDTDPFYLFRAPSYDNLSTGIPKVTLRVEYPMFQFPVVAPLAPTYVEPNPRIVGVDLHRYLDRVQSSLLIRIVQSDPLFDWTGESKQVLWNCRHYVIDIPSMLPKVLQCVDWARPDYRNEAYRLLPQWALPENPLDAIELLDARYADYRVREYAVNILRQLPDEDLQLCSLQLVQCLKFEPYHDSVLARFMIERAMQSPYVMGHTLFWHLKAEVHDPYVCERFSLILEELLSYTGIFVDELYKQVMVVNKLQQIAEKIQNHSLFGDEDAKKAEYHRLLEQLNRDLLSTIGKFQIPLNPRLEASTLIVEKCRYMSSKMVPLWLVFNNADPDGPPIQLIFKSGDDLRQDLLTLQLLRVMDRLWLREGLDMRLKPYNVIATGVNSIGEGVGMIEVVLNSDTTSGIQLKYGGGARGALKNDPLDLYIREHNRDSQTYIRAVDNFVRSCAGYCVATFVLGIGDRHNGNIMLTKGGHLFHIDFGHFLGNFKKKFGVNRERAAFVFTPEMAYVMGGKEYVRSNNYIEFKRLCGRSFKVLRSNGALLEILFILMVVAGMPELQQESDINYLREKLLLDVSSKAAVTELYNELKKAVESTSRRVDNYIHNIKHG